MSPSLMSKFVKIILKHTKPSYMTSKDELDKYLTDNNSKIPDNFFKSFDFNGIEVFKFGDNEKDKIIYLHGGAFINEINYQHFLYCYLISIILNIEVLAPVYPLAPNNSYKSTYGFLLDFYKSLSGNITIMGDSAGGGIALSFCQYLNTVNIPQPKHIIAISPWVDLSMSGDYGDESNDVVLGKSGLEEIGKLWAGNLNTKDFKVSPLYGCNKGLAQTLIFTGTDEIFHDDIKKYFKNLKNDDVNARLITGEGLFHVYPLFPIPEAVYAFKEIKNEIK